jgi:hypothetical protein
MRPPAFTTLRLSNISVVAHARDSGCLITLTHDSGYVLPSPAATQAALMFFSPRVRSICKRAKRPAAGSSITNYKFSSSASQALEVDPAPPGLKAQMVRAVKSSG